MFFFLSTLTVHYCIRVSNKYHDYGCFSCPGQPIKDIITLSCVFLLTLPDNVKSSSLVNRFLCSLTTTDSEPMLEKAPTGKSSKPNLLFQRLRSRKEVRPEKIPAGKTIKIIVRKREIS